MTEIVNWIGRALLVAGCVVAFAATLTLAFMDKPAVATITGSLTMVFLVFTFLPLMENFEVWGLKAKLRDKVNEAESLVDQLRSHVGTSSKIMLHQLAYGDRLTSPSWQTKADFLKEIERNLSAQSISPTEVKAMKEPVLRFLVIDLLNLTQSVISERVDFRRKEIAKEFSAAFPGGTHVDDIPSSTYLALDAKRKRLRNNVLPTEVLTAGFRDRPSKIVRDMVGSSNLPTDDVSRLHAAFSELTEIADGVMVEDTITAQAIEFLNRFPEPTDWLSFYNAAFEEVRLQPRPSLAT